ncbi:GrpB family protein [Serratia marcescens]|nr:GrpB family protein [Serratia marcescens]
MARTALPASEQAIRQLAFRDFLRKHHGIAEQHKHQAAEDRRQNPAAYGRLKNELVQRHEQPAPAWLAAGESPCESGPDGRIHISPPWCV